MVLPPLRDRPRELALLIRALPRRGLRAPGAAGADRACGADCGSGAYAWPGNVRELKNAMEYIAAAADGIVELAQLPQKIGGARATPPEPSAPPSRTVEGVRFVPLAGEIEALERARLREALEAADGVKTKAARLIDMPLRTFVAKLKEYGIAVERDDD